MKKEKETTVDVATEATEGTAPVATVETASDATAENGAYGQRFRFDGQKDGLPCLAR